LGVAADLSALAEAAVRREVEVVHGDQDAALGRFQTVAHVGKRACHDDAHGVVEVGATHLLLDGNRPNIPRFHSVTAHNSVSGSNYYNREVGPKPVTAPSSPSVTPFDTLAPAWYSSGNARLALST